MRGMVFDDPLCRYLAAEAGVVVVNVDYVVAPQYRFPARRSRRSRSSVGWPSTAASTVGTAAG